MAMLSRVHDRAREALRGGDLETASSLVSLIWRHFPEDVDTLELQGEVELARGHRIEARSSLATVLDIDPERLLARSGLALIAEEEDDLDEALRQFEFAYALDTGNQQLAAEIARLHSRLNHTMPVDPEASRYAVAWRHLWEGRYDRATSLFQSGLKADPESVEQAVGLAQSLWFAGQSSAAEEVAGDVVTSHPNCLKPLAILAGVAFSRGDEAALSILRRTAQLNPGNGVARAVFVAASLPFPRVESDAEIPDEELIDAGLSQVPVLSVGNGDNRSEQSVRGLQVTELGVSEEDASQDYRPVQPMETAAESECVRQRDRVPEYWASSPLVDMWRRLRMDPLSAPEVADELLSMAESDPADAALLWLAADALALSGRFRRATALYRRIGELGGHSRLVNQDQGVRGSGLRPAQFP